MWGNNLFNGNQNGYIMYCMLGQIFTDTNKLKRFHEFLSYCEVKGDREGKLLLCFHDNGRSKMSPNELPG